MNNTEPLNKKEFGINIYKKLNDSYGKKSYYELSEIQESIKVLDYPNTWECWALVAFMMPANVGEYFRAKGTPMDIVKMKKEFISAMTNGERDNLSLPSGIRSEYDIENNELLKILTNRSLTNYIAAHVGYNIGKDLG